VKQATFNYVNITRNRYWNQPVLSNQEKNAQANNGGFL